MPLDNVGIAFLWDDPSPKDFFGAHSAIAAAIAARIRREDRGAGILLSGPFGSGKSTVVGLLAKKLQSDDATQVLFLTPGRTAAIRCAEASSRELSGSFRRSAGSNASVGTTKSRC